MVSPWGNLLGRLIFDKNITFNVLFIDVHVCYLSSDYLLVVM